MTGYGALVANAFPEPDAEPVSDADETLEEDEEQAAEFSR